MRLAILAFVFGVWLLQQQPVLPEPTWVVGLPALVGLAFVLRKVRVLVRPLTMAGALLAGFSWAGFMAQQRLADELPPPWQGQDIQLVGVVASLPQKIERGERFEFDVEQVATEGAHVPRHISLTRYSTGYRQPVAAAVGYKFRPGERWRLTVRLKRPHGSYNPLGFDFEAWALERNIRATGYIREQADSTRLAPLVPRPGYLVERLRMQIRERFQSVLTEARYGAMLQALAIGDDDAIREEDWETVRRTGVIHLMSISGLHVTMLASLAFACVYAGWRRVERLALWLPARKAATLAGLVAAVAYALIAGFAVPTQRTLYMLAVLAVALWAGRTIALSLVLCWALLAVVLLDPWAVLAPGFWLSFGAVALLGYAGSNRMARPGWLAATAHAQWVVTLGLTPLLLALFQQVSLVSPLANALAIPLISLVVTPLTLLGVLLPFDAILLAAHAVMGWCMGVLQLVSGLPLAVWQQHAPPVWAVCAAVVGVLWLLAPRGFPMRWVGAIVLTPLFLLLPPAPLPGEMRVAVLDVGQGETVLLQTARHALLYDAGPRYSEQADSGNRIILPYLRVVGVSRLDGLVLSHDDVDHTGGAASLLRGIPVGWLASSLPPQHPVLHMAPRSLRCFAGQSWTWDGVRFDVLHPGLQSYAVEKLKDNQRSCVLKASSAHGSVLLAGDIERAAEEELLQNTAVSLQADVLVVPHHGSKTSSTAAFIAAVAPRAAVFTVGYRNRFGHPKAEVVERYRAQGSRIYRSDEDGALLFGYASTGLEVGAWRRRAPRYWHDAPARVAENGGAG